MTRALMLIDVQRNMLEAPTPVPSAASVRDALQDLLLRARQAGALPDADKLIDNYRRSSRLPVVPLEQVVETVYYDETLTPEQFAIRREELERLYQAIEKLSLLQQQVLQLRFGDGLRFADIAKLLDKGEGAVRKLHSRTIARLRTIYQQK